MTPTPRTQEAIERWRQGKINVFDEMAALEVELCQAHNQIARLQTLLETPSPKPTPYKHGFPSTQPKNGQHVLWIWAEACHITCGDFYNDTPRDAAKNYEPIPEPLPSHFLPWSKVNWWPQL